MIQLVHITLNDGVVKDQRRFFQGHGVDAVQEDV
jgi:hypothetical protein